MFDARSGRGSVGGPTVKMCAVVLAIMSSAASAQSPATAQPVGATPQASTAAPPKAIDLSTVPKIDATPGTVIKQVPRPQNGLSDSEYRALKARAARHSGNAPTGKMLPPPAPEGEETNHA